MSAYGLYEGSTGQLGNIIQAEPNHLDKKSDEERKSVDSKKIGGTNIKMLLPSQYQA